MGNNNSGNSKKKQIDRKQFSNNVFSHDVLSGEEMKKVVTFYTMYAVDLAVEFEAHDWGTLKDTKVYKNLFDQVMVTKLKFNQMSQRDYKDESFGTMFYATDKMFDAYDEFMEYLEENEIPTSNVDILNRIDNLRTCLNDGISDPDSPESDTVEKIKETRDKEAEKESVEQKQESAAEAEKQDAQKLINLQNNAGPVEKSVTQYADSETQALYKYVIQDILFDLRKYDIAFKKPEDKSENKPEDKSEKEPKNKPQSESTDEQENPYTGIKDALEKCLSNLGRDEDRIPFGDITGEIDKAINSFGSNNKSNDGEKSIDEEIIELNKEKLTLLSDASVKNIPDPEEYVKSNLKLENYSPKIVYDNIPKELQKRYSLMVDNNNMIGRVVPKKAMTNKQMYEMLMNNKYDEVREKLAGFRKLAMHGVDEYSAAKDELKIDTSENSISRIVGYAMDMSGTPAARARNKALAEKVATPEGRAEFINDTLKELLKLDISDITAYYDETGKPDRNHIIDVLQEKPALILTAYAVGDLLKNVPEGVDHDLIDKMNKCQMLISGAGALKDYGLNMSSPYYGTMPENLTMEDATALMGPMNEVVQQKIDAGYDIELDPRGKDLGIAGIRMCNILDQVADPCDVIIRNMVKKKELSGPIYELEAWDENGKYVGLDDGARLANKNSRVTFGKAPLNERIEIENLLLGSKKEAALNLRYRPGMSKEEFRTYRKADTLRGDLEEISEEDELAYERDGSLPADYTLYERMENLPEDRKKLFEVIEENDIMLSAMFPEMQLTFKEKVEMAEGKSEREELHQRAVKYLDRQKLAENRLQELMDEYKVSGDEIDPGLRRIIRYAVKLDDTDEARNENIKLVKQLKTNAGQLAFAEKVLRDMIALDPKDMLFTDEKDCLDKAEKYGNVMATAFAANDILTNGKNLRIDPELKAEYKRIHTMAQCGVNFARSINAMASVYYITMNPRIEEKHIMAMAGPIIEKKDERLEAGIVQKGSTGGDKDYDDLMLNIATHPEIAKEAEYVSKAIDDHRLNDCFGRVDAYDEKGEKIESVAEGYNALTKGKNITFKPRSDEEIKKVNDILNGKSVNEASNKLNFDDLYDMAIAREEYIERVNNEYEQKEKQISEALRTLEDSLKRFGLDMKNPVDLSRIVAFVANPDGGYKQESVFCDYRKCDTANILEAADIQTPIERLPAGKLQTKLSQEDVLRIYDSLQKGQLFVVEPGGTPDKIRHIYLQKDGYATVAHSKEEIAASGNAYKAYYNIESEQEKDRLENYAGQVSDYFERLEGLANEEEKIQKSKERDDVKKAWEEKREAVINGAEKKENEKENEEKEKNPFYTLWNDAHHNNEIIAKGLHLASAMNFGMSKADFLKNATGFERKGKWTTEELINRVNEAGADIKYQRPADVDVANRKRLSKEAFDICMEIAANRHESINRMDKDDPAIREVITNRGLAALILFANEGKRAENEKTAHEWAAAAEAERKAQAEGKKTNEEKHDPEALKKMAEIWDKSIRDRLNVVREERLDRPMSDEELVKNYKKIFENVFFFPEIEANYAYAEKTLKLPVNQELKKEVLSMTGTFMYKYMHMQAKMGMITSPYYAEINTDTLMKHVEAVKVLEDNLFPNENPEEYKFFSMTKTFDFGKSAEYYESIMSSYGENMSREDRKKMALYDEDGKELTSFNLQEHFANGKTLYVKGPDDTYKVFKADAQSGELVSSEPTAEHSKALDNIHYTIDLARYKETRIAPEAPRLADHMGRGLQMKYAELYSAVDSVDSIFKPSSPEFADIKAELKRIADSDNVPRSEEAYYSLYKVNNLAAQYIANKKALGELSEYTSERLTKITDVFKETGKLIAEHRREFVRHERLAEARANNNAPENGEIKIPVEVNDFANAAKYLNWGKPVKSSLTEEEKAKRRELRLKLLPEMEKLIPIDPENGVSSSKDDLRFVNEFILRRKHYTDGDEPTAEELAENEIIKAAFLDPDNHVNEVEKYMEELYGRFEEMNSYNGGPLYGKEVSDENLVSNCLGYLEGGRLILQLQNMEEFCNKHNILTNSGVRNRANLYNAFANESTYDKERLDAIASPMYAELDFKDIKGTLLDVTVMPEGVDLEDAVIEALGYPVDGVEAFERYGKLATDMEAKKMGILKDYAEREFAYRGEVKSSNLRVINPDNPEKLYFVNSTEATALLTEGKAFAIVDIMNEQNLKMFPAGGFDALREHDIAAENVNINQNLQDDKDQNENDYCPADVTEADYVDKEKAKLKDTYDALYTEINNADSHFVNSSKEFAGIKKELKTVKNSSRDLSLEERMESLQKLIDYADTYIRNKKDKTLTSFETGRLNAVKKVKELAERHITSDKMYAPVNKLREERLARELQAKAEADEKQKREEREAAEKKAQEKRAEENQKAETERINARGELREGNRLTVFEFLENRPEKPVCTIFKNVLEFNSNMLTLTPEEAAMAFAMLMSKPATEFPGIHKQPELNKMDMLGRLLNCKEAKADQQDDLNKRIEEAKVASIKLPKFEQDLIFAEAAKYKKMTVTERNGIMKNVLKGTIESLNNFVTAADKLDHKVALAGAMIEDIVMFSQEKEIGLIEIVAPTDLAKTEGSINLGKIAYNGYIGENTLKYSSAEVDPQNYVKAAEDFMYMKTMEGLMNINASANRSSYAQGKYPASAPQLLQGNGETPLANTAIDAANYKGKATKIQEFLREMVASSDFCKNLGKMSTDKVNEQLEGNKSELNSAIRENTMNVLLETGSLLGDGKKKLEPSPAQKQIEKQQAEKKAAEMNKQNDKGGMVK